VLSFDSTDDPVVYLENAWYDQLLERDEQVSKYKILLDLLRQRALDPSASEQLIRKIADEFR